MLSLGPKWVIMDHHSRLRPWQWYHIPKSTAYGTIFCRRSHRSQLGHQKVLLGLKSHCHSLYEHRLLLERVGASEMNGCVLSHIYDWLLGRIRGKSLARVRSWYLSLNILLSSPQLAICNSHYAIEQMTGLGTFPI